MYRRGLILAGVLVASYASADPGSFFLNPDIHGNNVVFSREGDIWLGDLTTKKATRLTRHQGQETFPRFSPDGSQIAFVGQYDGANQIYIMPVKGGIAKKITNRSGGMQFEDWTPDGKSLIFRNQDVLGFMQAHTVPVSGGVATQLPLEFFGQGSIAPDGKTLAFTRFADVSGGAWFRYYGGSRNDIWIGDLEKKSFKKIFESKHQSQYPVWAKGRVWFLHEENAKWSLMSVRPDGSDSKRHAGPYNFQAYDLKGDDNKLIFVAGSGVEIYDIATGQTSQMTLDMTSDNIHMRPLRVAPDNFVQLYAVSTGGKRVFAIARGQIASLPVGEGEARIWKATPGVRYKNVAMSPDGKKVAYVSDETREEQVFVSNADGSSPVQITKDSARQILSIIWSPDSQWIAVGDSETRTRVVKADGSMDREVSRAQRSEGSANLNHAFTSDSKWLAVVEQIPWTKTYATQISLVSLESFEKKPVTQGWYTDDNPAFSTDGKWMAFIRPDSPAAAYDNIFSQLASNMSTSVYVTMLQDGPSPFLVTNAEENAPAPVKAEPKTGIEFENILSRQIKVPLPSGTYTQVAVVGSRVIVAGGGQILFYDLATKQSGAVTQGFGFEVSGDGKSLMIIGAGLPRVIPVNAAGLPPTAGVVSSGGLTLEVDPAKEWQQVFWDAWRLCRDYFYQKNMHGADWNAIGAKYAKLLPQLRSRSELTELIRWMQAELSIGHSFRAPTPNPPVPNPSTQAFLGIETEATSTYPRISRIYDGDQMIPRSPMAEPGLGVKVGQYLIEVNGQKLNGRSDYSEALLDRAGQVVSVVVNDSPTPEGAKKVFVRAISVAAHRTLWSRDIVKQRREFVDKESGGKIGYIFLAAMGDGDMDDFIKQYFPQLGKEAIIIDIRGNNGGYIGGVLVNILSKKPTLRRSVRGSIEAGTRYHDAFEGHLCVIINHDSYSDGEGFPYRFRAANLGPLIGTNTYGALVGSAPMWPLIDGGGIQVPRYGNYWEDKWVVEGPGVAPDIRVEADPNDYAKGIDTQLVAAINEMKRRIAAKPIVRPVQPPDRDLTKGGGK